VHPLRKTVVLTVIAALLAAGGGDLPGLTSDGRGEQPSVGGPQFTLTVVAPSCCGVDGECCCRAAKQPAEPVAAKLACCGGDEPQQQATAAAAFATQADSDCSADSPLCTCTTQQQVPLERAMPMGLPAPPADGEICVGVADENVFANDELYPMSSSSSVPVAAAPLPLPVLVQLATLCCWRT
jgi:hypothetical protein